MCSAPTVLVGDGDRDCADVVAMMLNTSGLHATAVYDGVQLLAAAKHVRPASVVMDIVLPGLSGLKVARDLRTAFGRSIQLVAYTAQCSPKARELIIDADFDNFVSKTAEPAEMLQVLSPSTFGMVMRSTYASVDQIRGQLRLAGSLLDHAQMTLDPAHRDGIRQLVANRIASIRCAVQHLPVPPDTRETLYFEVDKLLKRLKQ